MAIVVDGGITIEGGITMGQVSVLATLFVTEDDNNLISENNEFFIEE
jgi:hypothetical protein